MVTHTKHTHIHIPIEEHSSGSSKSPPRGLDTGRSLLQTRVHPLHLPTVQEQISPEEEDEDNSYVDINMELKTACQGECFVCESIPSIYVHHCPSINSSISLHPTCTTCPILPHHLIHPTSQILQVNLHQSHEPNRNHISHILLRTVTQEQRHPFPATPRQGMGPPAMPQVSLDELKSSKVLNSRRTTCTGPQGM